METKSAKTEILNSIKELKEKGVNIIVHNEFIDRLTYVGGTISGSFNGHNVVFGSNAAGPIASSCGCGGNCACKKHKVTIVKNPSDLSLEIYQNSTEDEIQHNINLINNELKACEDKRKSTAIVDFLRAELR